MNQEKYLEAVQTAERLRSLLASGGWKIIDTYLKRVRASNLERLVTAKDMKEVLFCQAAIQTIDALYSEIESLIRNGETARQALNTQGGGENING